MSYADKLEGQHSAGPGQFIARGKEEFKKFCAIYSQFKVSFKFSSWFHSFFKHYFFWRTLASKVLAEFGQVEPVERNIDLIVEQ